MISTEFEDACPDFWCPAADCLVGTVALDRRGPGTKFEGEETGPATGFPRRDRLDGLDGVL